MNRQQAFRQALVEQSVLKVISGIDQFDMGTVTTLVQTTQSVAQGNAAVAVDVAANPEIVRAVREAFSGLVFASSVKPQELLAAVDAGADAVELGNFDALYAQGFYISAEDVLALAKETVALVGDRALICITVPGHLSVDVQINLAQALEVLGVDLLQTEGATRLLSETPAVKTLSMAEKAALSADNVKALTAAVRLPIMAASGMDVETMGAALFAGASAIGVGSAVNKGQDEATVVATLTAMMTQLAANKPQPVAVAS